jgi:hypothetical protein
LTPLRGRRFGVLAHQASVTPDLRPIHLALLQAGCRPAALFAPEHGYYGVEQDMVAAVDTCDCLTGAPIRSLYGEDAESLRPSPGAFDGLDLLIVDLQDVGARYYTFPATAVTSCPFCGRLVEPAADSTWVIAWYTCRRCGDEWSARLRNGRPDIPWESTSAAACRSTARALR